jgi:hypothetical protein
MDRSDFQEQLSTLYLRLNGYFTTSFIVHAPLGEYDEDGELRTNRAELDVLAVRFPHNAEPEREIKPSPFLEVSSEYIDILISEVKGGTRKSPRFNSGLRENPYITRSVLRWVGLFEEGQVENLVGPIMTILAVQNPNNHEQYRQYIVPEELSKNVPVRVRAILFAPDRPPAQQGQTKFIHGQEVIDYIWMCLRPDKPRPESETRYNLGLWGIYEPLISFFKTAEHKPNNITEIYTALNIEQ